MNNKKKNSDLSVTVGYIIVGKNLIPVLMCNKWTLLLLVDIGNINS